MPIIRHVAPRVAGGTAYETYQKVEIVPTEEFGRPSVNPPTVVIEDNVELLSFTLNTDRVTFKFPVPYDLYSGGIELGPVWTNDGGTDDNGLTVRWQFGYQISKSGEVVDGDHVNSPLLSNDTYEGSLGWIEHHAPYVTIAAADFAGMECIYVKLSAVTPAGTQLTCEPHLIGLCIRYTARRVVL